MSVIIDSYSESNYNNALTFYSGYSIQKVGQSFHNTNGCNLLSAKFYCIKIGSPTGNIYANVYAHTGTYGSTGKPTGSALATSDAVDVSTLDTNPNWKLIEFTFSGANQIALSENTNYVVVIDGSTIGDSTNRPVIGTDSTSPTHGGNLSYFDGSNWVATLAQEACFYVYGTGSINFSVLTASFALTGVNVILSRTYNFVVSATSFALTGINAIFSKGYNLVCSATVYTLTGIDAIITSARKLTASVANFVLTGINIVFGGRFYIRDSKGSGSYTKDSEGSASYTGDTEGATAYDLLQETGQNLLLEDRNSIIIDDYTEFSKDSEGSGSYTGNSKGSGSYTNDPDT